MLWVDEFRLCLIGPCDGSMVWSCDRILGRRRGPCWRMGDLGGVVRAVLLVMTDSGEESQKEPLESAWLLALSGTYWCVAEGGVVCLYMEEYMA